MAKTYSTFALGAEQIPVVFPLVREAMPEIDLSQWRRFAHPLVDGLAPSSSGIVGLRNAAGYACGLLTFRVERALRHGAALAIDLFVALDLVNDEQATFALLEAAEIKARALGCAALHIRADPAQRTLVERLVATGHRQEASLFWRQVMPAPPPN